jgi:hypothetical protein
MESILVVWLHAMGSGIPLDVLGFGELLGTVALPGCAPGGGLVWPGLAPAGDLLFLRRQEK